MATFVLVGGFWLGGWAWDRVARRLRADGHEVRAQTLTGLGERVHLATPDVNLNTHIDDVVNTLVYGELRDVVLVGHSYAGIVITGVADRAPDRIGRLVYVDAGPFPDGAALVDSWQPEEQALIERLAADEGDGWRFRLPDWGDLATFASLDGVDDKARARWRALATPQPLATLTQPLRLRGDAAAAIPSTLIACSFPLTEVREMIAAGHPWFAALSGPIWRLIELPTGHWPMFSRPDDLADLLANS